MIEYSHTTVDWAQPNVWPHERDKRDAEEGREDVAPVDDPITEAIAHRYAIEEKLLSITVHCEATVVEESPVEVTVNV